MVVSLDRVRGSKKNIANSAYNQLVYSLDIKTELARHVPLESPESSDSSASNDSYDSFDNE